MKKRPVVIRIDNNYFKGHNSVAVHTTTNINNAIKFNDPIKAETCIKFLTKKFNLVLSSSTMKVINL